MSNLHETMSQIGHGSAARKLSVNWPRITQLLSFHGPEHLSLTIIRHRDPSLIGRPWQAKLVFDHSGKIMHEAIGANPSEAMLELEHKVAAQAAVLEHFKEPHP